MFGSDTWPVNCLEYPVSKPEAKYRESEKTRAKATEKATQANKTSYISSLGLWTVVRGGPRGGGRTHPPPPRVTTQRCRHWQRRMAIANANANAAMRCTKARGVAGKSPCKNGSHYTWVSQLHSHQSRYTVPLGAHTLCHEIVTNMIPNSGWNLRLQNLWTRSTLSGSVPAIRNCGASCNQCFLVRE